jgi:anti-sigma regulatory factor (Ser/Thr protein kinase)
LSASNIDAIELRSEIGELERVFGFIDRFCARAGIPDAVKYKLFLVSEELAMNSIKHGYGLRRDGRIGLKLIARERMVEIEFEDEAPAFDILRESREPDLGSELDDRRVGGLGVHMLKMLCQRLDYRREGPRNVIVASIAPESGESDA